MEPTRVSHFEIVRLIGRGGMGEVHEAMNLKLRRRVAVKFLSPELAMDPEALARFEREALSAAEPNHPHIATVYAFEQDGDRPFIAMELLAGPSLRERIECRPCGTPARRRSTGDHAARPRARARSRVRRGERVARAGARRSAPDAHPGTVTP